MVTVLLEWDDLNQAREFADSPRLKDAMGRSGVQGVPCFYFLKEAQSFILLVHKTGFLRSVL